MVSTKFRLVIPAARSTEDASVALEGDGGSAPSTRSTTDVACGRRHKGATTARGHARN